MEFLVDAIGGFYFLEMNTRIQVEHGVTELVTGVDLVAGQLRVALGSRSRSRRRTSSRGCAIELRIDAEDPSAGFRPAPGTVTGLALPLGPGIRNDFGVEAGDVVPAMYDSLFGKVLARGADRDTARRRLVGALGELRVAGPPTTAPYLRTILESASFTEGRHDTGSVEREWVPEPATAPAAPPAPHTSGTNAVPARLVRIATDRGPVEIAVYGRAQRPGVVAAPSERPSRDSGSGSTTGAARRTAHRADGRHRGRGPGRARAGGRRG